MECDVAVVGAGASGLRCAAQLRSSGLRVTVLESRPAIGGRLRTWHPPDGGPPLELGAQVVHGSASPVAQLVGPLEQLPRDVTASVVLGGALRPMATLWRGRRAPWQVQAALGAATPSADADLSVQQWLSEHVVAGADGAAAREWLRQHWAADPADLSVRGVAQAQRDDPFGDAEFVVPGGFARLARTLADGLDVRCGAAVRELRWTQGDVVLLTDAGEVRARAAVLTVPPPVVVAGLPRMDLPAYKLAAAACLPAGDAACAVVTYPLAAPRDEVVFDVDGRLGFVRARRGSPHICVVAKAAAADTVRSGDLAAALRVALSWTGGQHPVAVSVADWGRDPWSRGAFTHPRQGATWAAAAWARPVADTIFFAGEATKSATLLPRVHAALASATEAADQVKAAMTR